jgi:hypothetical protein
LKFGQPHKKGKKYAHGISGRGGVGNILGKGELNIDIRSMALKEVAVLRCPLKGKGMQGISPLPVAFLVGP